MKSELRQLWSSTGLSNGVALALLCLIASLPLQQCFATTDVLLIEQLEYSDSETEQESTKEIKQVDSDEFLIEGTVLSIADLHSAGQYQRHFRLFSTIYVNIFDPPPKASPLL